MSDDEERHATVPIQVPAKEKRHLNAVVLLALAAGAAYLLGRMLWPFLTAIIFAAVLAILAHPWYRRLRDLLRSDMLAAFLGTGVLFFLVFLPLLAVSVALFNSLETNVATLSDRIGGFVAPGGQGRSWLNQALRWLGLAGLDVTESLRGQLREMGSFLAGQTMSVLSGLGGGLVQAGVALFTLYYFLRDGEGILDAIEGVIPLDDDVTEALMARSRDIVHATMFGNVAVGIAQGTLGGLAFWAVGIPGAVLWGTVMGVVGLLPVLGTPIVWGPAVVILFLQGEVTRGLLLLAAGTLIVSTVDNVLRATVVSGRAQLHPLVVFFSALGGILLFGVTGVFLGPILFVVAISILEITRAVLDPEQKGAPPVRDET